MKKLLSALTALLLVLITVLPGAACAEDASGVSVYRLYCSANNEHLFTTDYNEVTVLSTQRGWTYEGIGWYAPENGTPVYRLYNSALQNHLYTTDLNEIEVLTTREGWTIDFNGEALFYSGGDVPIYRLYNRELRGLHLWTTDTNEYEVLPSHGWTQEGVALYGIAVGVSIPASEPSTEQGNSTPGSGSTGDGYEEEIEDSSLTVYITDTGTKYHRESCRYLDESKHAIGLRSAQRNGYEPCKVCKPPV